VFRVLCLVTAVANLAGNVGLLLLYRPVFALLGVPPPSDLRWFALEASLSFTMGVVALLIFLDRDGERTLDLLKIGIVGKGLYGLITYYFYAVHQVHWLFLVFAAWDALFVVVFFLYWIQLQDRDLLRLQREICAGIERPPTHKALLLGFSFSDNGRKAVERMRAGLLAGGYRAVDVHWIHAQERLFRWPLGLAAFARITARAMLRAPARIAPLDVPEDHDYDLIVVQSQTWMLGMSAPTEAVFLDPRNAGIFRGRDAAGVVVCRGAYQRTHAMLVRWLERRGANVVGARGYVHAGWEPRRLMSLWFYLVFRRPGVPRWLAEPHYGLSERSLARVEQFGRDLAQRARSRPHWTLLLRDGREAGDA
jgi:hypothetical protein